MHISIFFSKKKLIILPKKKKKLISHTFYGFTSKQWNWRWVKLWIRNWELQIVLGAGLLGPSFSGILPWQTSLPWSSDCDWLALPSRYFVHKRVALLGAGIIGIHFCVLLNCALLRIAWPFILSASPRVLCLEELIPIGTTAQGYACSKNSQTQFLLCCRLPGYWSMTVLLGRTVARHEVELHIPGSSLGLMSSLHSFKSLA